MGHCERLLRIKRYLNDRPQKELSKIEHKIKPIIDAENNEEQSLWAYIPFSVMSIKRTSMMQGVPYDEAIDGNEEFRKRSEAGDDSAVFDFLDIDPESLEEPWVKRQIAWYAKKHATLKRSGDSSQKSHKKLGRKPETSLRGSIVLAVRSLRKGIPEKEARELVEQLLGHLFMHFELRQIRPEHLERGISAEKAFKILSEILKISHWTIRNNYYQGVRDPRLKPLVFHRRK